MLAALLGHPPPDEVGVLYIVYEQRFQRNAKASRLGSYLAEAARSARSVRALNPALPVALSTTSSLPATIAGAFERVLQLAPATASEPLWAPRLRALAASPFGLTLALDSHATACSALLHQALLAEARRPAPHFDLAVNVEASECLPWAPKAGSRAGLGRIYFPTHPRQLMPHNFALLLRKGPGLDALLSMWMSALERMQRAKAQPDDQWALSLTLRKLYKAHGCADGPPDGCRRNATVWRLREAVALGFKSATKRCLGYFPRYTRLLTQPVLVTHHPTPYPWPTGQGAARTPRHRNVCALLNSQAHVPRLALLAAKGHEYELLSNRSACNDVLRAAAAPDAAKRAAPICGLLPAATAPPVTAAGAPTGLAESMDDFYADLARLRRAYPVEFCGPPKKAKR